MASIGHLAAGLCCGKWYSARIASIYTSTLVALSFLPDADVIGFKFGIEYASPFGHRGASHSILFALVVGSLVGYGVHRLTRRFDAEGGGARAKPFGGGAGVFMALCVCVTMSHGLFDMLTDGGHGVALFWPIDDTRLFFPWQPLPVAPIGRRFFTTPRGWYVAAVECACFSPFLLYAIFGRWRAKKLSQTN